MDLERAMEFLLEQQAVQQARFDAQMAVVSANLAEVSEKQKENDTQIARTNATLSRAIRLSVEEHRRERVRRREMQARADERTAALEANMADLAKSLTS